MGKITTIDALRQLPIVHTDTGYFLFFEGEARNEFLVLGKIVKKRAGLYFIEIEEEKYTTNANSKFSVGEEVICVLRANILKEKVNFLITGLEKIKSD